MVDIIVSEGTSFINAVFRVAFSGVGAQAVVFLSLPFLTRVYDTSSFGVWALIQSISILIGAFATLRYELAVVLPETHAEAANILFLGAGIAFFISVLSIPILFILAPMIFDDAQLIVMILWVVPVLVFFTALFQLGLSWFTRNDHFALYGFSQFLFSSLSALLPLLFSIEMKGVYGLIMGSIVAAILVPSFMWIKIIISLNKDNIWREVSFYKMKLVGLKFRNYPLYMTPYTLMGTFRDRFIFFFLGIYGSTSEVGSYSMALRLTNAPNSLAASALRPVFFQKVSKSQSSDVYVIIRQVMFWLSILYLPPLMFFFNYSEELVMVILGKNWVGATDYILILSVALFPLLLGNWMDRYFDALGRQKLAFGLEIFFSIIAVSSVISAFWLGATTKQAIVVYAVVMGIYFSVWIWVLFVVAEIPRNIMWYLLRVVGIVVVIGGLVNFALYNVLSFMIALVSFVIIWMISVLLCFKFKSFEL